MIIKANFNDGRWLCFQTVLLLANAALKYLWNVYRTAWGSNEIISQRSLCSTISSKSWAWKAVMLYPYPVLYISCHASEKYRFWLLLKVFSFTVDILLRLQFVLNSRNVLLSMSVKTYIIIQLINTYKMSMRYTTMYFIVNFKKCKKWIISEVKACIPYSIRDAFCIL